MINTSITKAGAVGLAMATFVTVGGGAVAQAESFGPVSWSDGDDTNRYRRGVGTHRISANDCSGIVVIELRVDKIDAPDTGYGNKSVYCGSSVDVYSGINSSQTSYRGHFMQSRSNWYGTMGDKAV